MLAHPDRLLPTDPATKPIARRILDEIADLPIVSPHGHVDPRLLLDDRHFTDPATLLVTPDHYVTRLLHASGVDLADVGVAQGPHTEESARRAWRLLCENWSVFRGTSMRLWMEAQLSDLFGIAEHPSAGNADDLYDRVAARLRDDAFRPRSLYERFRIEVLATTDDPADDLAAHAALAADASWHGRVIPTFRPDRYLEVDALSWVDDVHRLGAVARERVDTYTGWVAAMEQRRDVFRAHGARSTDHSHEGVGTEPLAEHEAERIYQDCLKRTVTRADAVALRQHMLFEMARMSADDGLTMTLHPGVRRNHHTPTYQRFGPDTGHDIPLRGEFTDALRPLLERFGTADRFTVVLFTLDETVFSRELAPLASFYPSVRIGAPWWFLDAPDAILRWRSAVTEAAGFSRTSGFIDDTRAFCSIPARHDMARRIDARYLAGLVADHRLDEDEAIETAIALTVEQPRTVFGL